MKLIYSFLIVCLSTSAYAEVWNVEVGGGGLNGTPYYAPQNLVINQGDEVLWTWASGQHNVTQSSGPVFFGSGNRTAPSTFAFLFDVAGTYEYVCTVGSHANTQFGQIVVNPFDLVAQVNPIATRFSMFPNPASDAVNLEIEGAGSILVRILDLTGKLVVEPQEIISGSQVISVRNLESGIYFVEVSSAGGVIRKRLTVR